MVLVPENTLERMQQRQQILTPPVTQTLKNLDSEMSDILSSKQLDDEAKATLYNQVLQRYLTYYDQRKGQPLHIKLTTPKPVETPKPEDSKETSKGSTAEAKTIPTSAVEQEVMKSVPKLYKAGARQLLDKIKENSEVALLHKLKMIIRTVIWGQIQAERCVARTIISSIYLIASILAELSRSRKKALKSGYEILTASLTKFDKQGFSRYLFPIHVNTHLG